MQKHISTLFKITGLLIPLITFTIIGTFKLYITNITSVLNNPAVIIYALVVTIYTIYGLYNISIKRKSLKYFLLCALIVIIFPYDLKKPIFSLMHLLGAYSAFIIFNYILLAALTIKQKQYYFMMLGCCFALVIIHGSIIGICEAIYISYISILLLVCQKKTS